MKHVSLDTQDELVKHFILTLSDDPGGSVLELNGRAIVCMLPITPEKHGSQTGTGVWTEPKNVRRCALIDKEIAGTLLPEEVGELETLQQEMLRHRRQVAPLPLDEARRLHQQLLAKAQTTRVEG